MVVYERRTAGGRPRDLAITDFRFAERPDVVLAGRNGHSYLLYARSVRAPAHDALVTGDGSGNVARRVAEFAVYTFGGAAAVTAMWFGFLVPVAPAPATTAAFTTSPPAQPAPPAMFAGLSPNGVTLSMQRALRAMR
ncbi:MAG TPA: hypothetical protein VGX96_06830 [Candidatus Elarobacter sp.]|jgi:hypothetical protein|nr:hypothetical protein [Candidatus Elarobacter sp.]